MNRTKLVVAGAALTMLFAMSPKAFAVIIPCNQCNCGKTCSQQCAPASGPNTTCGALGTCSGSPSCSGGPICLTMGDFASLQSKLLLATPEDSLRGRVVARLTWRLAQYVEESGLGEVYAAEGGLLSGARGLAQSPDLSFVRHERLGVAGAPDLAVEVRSTHESAAVIAAKVQTWLAAGTRAVLVIDPATQIIALHRSQAGVKLLQADDLLEIPSLLPGWAVRAGDLFEN